MTKTFTGMLEEKSNRKVSSLDSKSSSSEWVLKIRKKRKHMRNIEVPFTPHFFRVMDSKGYLIDTVHISKMTEEEIKDIGKKWTEDLLNKSKNMHDVRDGMRNTKIKLSSRKASSKHNHRLGTSYQRTKDKMP